jgi:hypothetical protein
MSFDFSKLSRVPINDDITDNTYTIVANADDIQKASLKVAVNSRDNYTSDCEAYIESNPTKTPIDYIRTLSPLQPNTQNPNGYIRSGYIIFHDVYYLFEVYGGADHSYYDIIATDFSTDDVERYLFGSVASSPPIVQYNYSDIEKHFVIEASGTTDDGNVTCNKTFAQIKDAIDDGFRIELRYSHGNPMLRDFNDWIVDQVFIKYSGMDVTEVTFSDLLNDGVSGVYKSIMFNFATGSSTPTIVLEDENIASLRSGKMDKSEPSGTGMLTLIDKTNNDDYKFLRVYKENDDRAIEATFNPQGELIFDGSTEMFLSGLHVSLPTTQNEIANKQYVDNVAVSKVDNVDGTCKGRLSIKKPVQSSTVLAPTLEFGENDDNKFITICRTDEALDLSGFNDPNHFDPRISGLGDPVGTTDATNKRYVDSVTSGKIDSLNGNASGTLIISNDEPHPPAIRFYNDEDSSISPSLHSLYIELKRDYRNVQVGPSTYKRNKALVFSMYDNTTHTSGYPIIGGIDDPVELNDVANKKYVDSLAETISLPSNKTINLNAYQRKRVTISGQINELSFINLSGNGPEECWVIFKTSSTAYSSSKNFNMHTASGIVYPSNIDLGARECFALGKTYMIHFVKAKDTTNAWKTFATITEYNI